MPSNRKISELPTDAAPARTDFLTSLENGILNVKGLVSSFLGLTKDSDLNLTDITTNDVTTAAHGFVPKAPNDTTKFLRGDGTWAQVGPLGLTSYNPTLTDTSVTSTTGADLDATNLTVTFVVPASGRVLIGLSATAFSSTGAVALMFLLRDTSGNNIAGTKRQVTPASGTTGLQLPVHHRFVLSSLTPGATVTYRWGVMLTGAGTGHVRYGDDGAATGQEYGPAVMEVWAAP